MNDNATSGKKAVDVLEEAYRVVRLHGWCDQVYGLIEQVRELLENAEQSIEELNLVLRERTATSSSMEERALSLALLSYEGLSSSDVADGVFRHLGGRLTSQSFAFFVKFFFDGTSPIPEQVSYDITKRVFISFQRAIYQALQVREFHSEHPPQDILLYLSLLLSRHDLNEQNRAMVFLLLSRIDEPLPEALDTAVRNGMATLKNVVREVEERQESVLSDTLKDQPQVAGRQWEHHRGPTIEQPQRTTTPAGAAEETLSRDRMVWEVRHASDQGKTRPLGEAAYLAKNPELRSGGLTRGEPLAGYPASAGQHQTDVPASRAIPDGLWARVKRSGPHEPDSVAASDVSAPWSRQLGEQGRPAEDSRRSGGSFSGGSGEVEQRRRTSFFEIRFTRQSRELEELLGTLQQNGGPSVSEGATRPFELRKSLLHGLTRRWRLVVPILVLVALAAVVVVRVSAGATAPNRTSERPVPEQPAPDGPTARGSSTEQPAATQSIPKPSSDSDIDAPIAGSTSVEPELVAQDTRTIWRPRPGESLWILFDYLGTSGNRPDIVAPGQSWQGFLEAIEELNPGIEEMDLIFPQTEVVILDTQDQ
jgi:hypothetical protein